MSIGESSDFLLITNKRKPNFTEGESLYLIDQFERHKDVLTSKLNDATTNKQKVELWKGICHEYNSKNPVVLRTPNELKRKWKNMVGAAKKELLEMKGGGEMGDSMNGRKMSLVSERIIEIMKITEQNCKPPASVAGTFAVSVLDGAVFTENQATQIVGEQNGSIENAQQVLSAVIESRDVKPTSPGELENSAVVTETSQPTANTQDSPLSPSDTLAVSEGKTTLSKDVRVTSAEGIINVVFSQDGTVPPRTVTTTPEVRKRPITGERNRVLVSQQKRLLSTPLAQVIKKRRSVEEGLAHVRFEIEQLKKEKLIMEKEKLALEKEKLAMEKEKLSLEIQFLRDQMD